MMGKIGVGRTVGSIALVLGALTGPFNAFSYGSATTHLEVTIGRGVNANAKAASDRAKLAILEASRAVEVSWWRCNSTARQ